MAMEDVAALEKKLTGDKGFKHLSDIDKLYELCEATNLHVVAEALKAIQRVLTHYRQRVAAVGTSKIEGGAAIVDWLSKHSEAYYSTLAQLATSPSPRAQVCAIRLAMAAMQDEADEASAYRSSDGGIDPLLAPPPAADKRIQTLLTELLLAPKWATQAVECLLTEFAALFVDIRHYVLSHSRFCCEQVGKTEWGVVEDSNASAPAAKRRKQTASFVDLMRSRSLTPQDLFSRVSTLLRETTEPTIKAAGSAAGADEQDSEARLWTQSGRPTSFFLREYRRLYQDAWLQLLSLPAPATQITSVLQYLPARVMPFLSEPLMLADFYLRAFRSESLEVSVLSLSGLLVLLTKHGLGDPDTLSSSSSEFYAQLYSLIKLETFKLKSRARFQRLLMAALNSGLLPARFAAAFSKKCMRVAIVCSEPGTVMWLMAVAYTLIQKHHSHCQYLLHQTSATPEQSEGLSSDPFDGSATLSVALEQTPTTSLWELKLLLRHVLPAVATLAKLFQTPFFKPTSRKLDPDMYLDQSVERTYKQAMKSGERQAERWRIKGVKCPMAFKIDEDPAANDVVGWACGLSTEQRRIGAGRA